MSANQSKEGMDLVVKTVTHWLKGFIFLFGVYLVLCSHQSPGGGFAGGIVIACVFVLLTLAQGQRVTLGTLGKGLAAGLGSAGALLLLGILAPMLTGSPHLLSVGMMQVCDASIAFAVSMFVFVAFSVMAATHIEVKGDRRRMVLRSRGRAQG